MTLAWGFHYSVGGNKNDTGDFISFLNSKGVGVMMKGASDAGLCFEAQEKGKQYGVENILIWRATSAREDRADYWLAPSVAAAKKWDEIKNLWPPELDKNLVWWEVINEPRKEDAPDEVQPTWGNMHTTAWLGLFLVEMAKLMIPAGYKLCGPSFSSGEPEPEDWQLEGMATWLRYCADNPNKAAVSHHEYNYGNVPYADNFPWHYGRFESIIAAADLLGIPRTFSIFLTEFGWTYQTVPSWETAVPTLTEYAKLAAKFPQLKGVALWTLQVGWGGISDQLAQWISDNGNPMANWVINNQYPTMPQPQATADEFGATLPNEDDMEPKDCDLFLDLGRFVHLLPQDTTDDEIAKIARDFNAAKNSFVYSHDDAELIIAHGRGENPDGKKVSEVRIWEPERFADDVIDYFASRGYKYSIGYFDSSPPPQPIAINLKYRPCQTTVITQLFGANPGNYPLTPGHEGIDYAVGKDGAFYAAADGIVVHASDRKWSSDTASDYGWHVVLQHGDYCTVYAHARPDLAVAVGQVVTAGQVVGYSGNTGNSTGYHLHFGLLDLSGTIDPDNGYPLWTFGRPVNPAPFVTGKPAPPLPQPTIDAAPYFVPAAQYGPKIVMQVGDGTQPMQLEKRPSDVILRKGDGNWIDGKRYQDSEQWKVENGQIKKGKDTSDAGNGGRDGYDLGWVQWLPQFVSVGQTYHSTPTVKRFDRTKNCEVYSTSQANDYLHIKKIIPTWISPANSSIVLNDIMVIEWRSGSPDLSVPPNETYYFAKGIGYCGWGSHFIVEITEGQAPLTGALDCGM